MYYEECRFLALCIAIKFRLGLLRNVRFLSFIGISIDFQHKWNHRDTQITK